MGSYVADSVVLNWPRIQSFWFQHPSSGQVIQGRIAVVPSGIVTKIVTSPQQAVIVRSKILFICHEDAISRDWRFLVQSGASLSRVCKFQVWTVGRRTPTRPPFSRFTLEMQPTLRRSAVLFCLLRHLSPQSHLPDGRVHHLSSPACHAQTAGITFQLSP